VPVSIRKYAQHRNVSHTAVQKAIRQGRIRLTPQGQIDIEQADRDWYRNTSPSPSPERTPGKPWVLAERPAGPSFAQSRAVRELYMARLAKLDYEVRSGKLLDAREVESTVATIVLIARDRLLALPYRLAETVAAETNPAEVHSILNREIREALTELSIQLRERLSESAAAGEDSSATATEAETSRS
jgi:hypothetical protein